MIINVNFVSKEYTLKLMTAQLAQVAIGVAILFVILEFGGVYYFDKLIGDKQTLVTDMKAKIVKVKAEKAKLIDESRNIPDLSSKISILNDLFSQANLRFSEILYTLSKVTPSKIWFTSFNYIDNRVLLKGIAYDELAIYSLEKNLKDTGMYLEVKNDYIRDTEMVKQTVKDFQYQLIINPNVPAMQQPGQQTTQAAIAAGGVAASK